MHRNLDRRVETLVLLVQPDQIKEVSRLFDLAFDPTTSAWHLRSDGNWDRITMGSDGVRLRDYQETLVARQQRREMH